jgi:hypothetical protein
MKIDEMVQLINFFNKAPISDETNKVDFAKLNQKAVKYGYLIHPDCCNKYVHNWLDTLTLDYNATFYKEWNDILSKTRFELFIDQIMHYTTTYGQNFECEGNGYVPNSGSERIAFDNLKVILPISNLEIYERCLDVLTSGVALKNYTMKCMCNFIIEHSHHNISFNILNSIKNKEAQAYIACVINVMPTDEFAILRCLMYRYTESCLIIKNKRTINSIRLEGGDYNNYFSATTDKNLEALSRIFYRFKPLFLAFKNKKNAKVINKIRKLAKRFHTPLKTGFWEDVISQKKDLNDVINHIMEVDNFKKVKLLQAVKVALYSNENSKTYNIRNGKIFTRIGYKPNYDKEYLKRLEVIIETALVHCLSEKACKVHLPSEYNITLPSSEKSFVGNYPFGSNIKFNKNAVVGIYWKNEWGTHDFDLSLVNFEGLRFGWNAVFNANGVVYSGDMTNADPHAVEAFYIPNKCDDCMVMVNQYRGESKSKFRFFIAEEKNPVSDIYGRTSDIYGRMVDPNDIRLDTMIDVNEEIQKTVGFIHDNSFYFMNLHSGGRIVSSVKNHHLEFIKTMGERTKCFVDLRTILSKAGFEFVDETDCEINFKNLEKDTLIKLLG